MANFISTTKRIVAKAAINPVWGWFVRHWGVATLAVLSLALLLDALRRSVPYPSLPSSVLSALMLLDALAWFVLTALHFIDLARRRAEVFRARRDGRL